MLSVKRMIASLFVGLIAAGMRLELLPRDDLYAPYLAAPKEPRIGDVKFYAPEQGWLWDVTLGGRAGLVRAALTGVILQLDVEGAAFVRLDLDDDRDLIASEFKYGAHLFALVSGISFRLGYYHLSAHLGDEAERHFPGRRPNGYSRDTIVAGVAVQVDALRSYLQIGFAPVVNGPAEPWEIEIGAEFLPACRKWWGNAFAAMHAHLRQENDFGGVVTLEAGWRWQSAEFGSILRIGLHGSLGRSPQYQFYDLAERQIGLAGGLDF